MSSNQNTSTHIFSQGGDLSQLTCGFPSEKNLDNEEQDYSIQEARMSHGHDETMSSRADSIYEENCQINNFVKVGLKQLEKKRIALINKDKALEEDIVKLQEKHKRQSEKNLELQMDIEERSIKYGNEIDQRNKVTEKFEPVENFIRLFENNFAKGVDVGKSIEDCKQYLEVEFDKIKKKSKASQEYIIGMKSCCTSELKKMDKKCIDLKDMMMRDREIMVGEIQTLAEQTEQSLNKISEMQEDIEKAVQSKAALIDTYNAVFNEHKVLNESISKIYEDLNVEKTSNAYRLQNLKFQVNTEGNNNCNLESTLKEKETLMNDLSTKLKELTNVLNLKKEAVIEAQKRIEKKVTEIDVYRNKESVLNDQENTLHETLKKYVDVEKENKIFKDNISLLEKEIQSNINVVTEKESVNMLYKKMMELEDKVNMLKENDLVLDNQLKIAKTTENKLSSSVKEDRIKNQEEREQNILRNETLKKRNEDLASEIAICSKAFEELQIFIENSKKKEKETERLIDRCKQTVEANEAKFLRAKEEQTEGVNKFNEKINEMEKNLEINEFFVMEAKPLQKELAITLEKKVSLEQELKILDDNYQKKINTLENNHRAKIQGMDSEMEKHSTIMKNIQIAEEETAEKLKKETKEEERTKNKLENELRDLHNKLKSLKNEEMIKRNKITKMEKRQQTIMKEIKVTREDIAQAVSGKVQGGQPMPFKRPKLMTPSSSAGSHHSLYGKALSKEEHTRNWVESFPEDDYEFSDV